MQLAGVPCAICKKNVLVDLDATWCAHCSTVLHNQCLATASEVCPTCHKRYDRPEDHFVFSRECPECFRRNEPPQPKCALCGTSTRWDNQADYTDFLAQMKKASGTRALRGIAELIGAAMCFLALVSMIFFTGRPGGFIWLSLILLGFMTLSVDGAISLIRSRRIGMFR